MSNARIEYDDEYNMFCIRFKSKKEALDFAEDLLKQIKIIDKAGIKFKEVALFGIDVTKDPEPKNFRPQDTEVSACDWSGFTANAKGEPVGFTMSANGERLPFSPDRVK